MKYKYFYLIISLSAIILWFLEKIDIITPYYLQIYILICINIILTVSLNLINGFCGQFSVGHAGFMAIGAYSACIITTILPKIYAYSFHSVIFQKLIFFFGISIGGFIAAVIAYFIGLPILRLKGDYLAICTLSFGEVVRTMIKLSDEIGQGKLSQIFKNIGGPRGLGNIPKLTNIFEVTIITIIIVYIIKKLVYSSYGRAWVSIRENEIAAEMMGINITRYKLLAFILAGFFAGISGGLYAHLLMFIHPDNFSFIKSVECLAFLYLGGIGSILGSIISASTMTFLLEFLRIIKFQEWRLVLYPLILIILMLTRPKGFFKKDI